MGLDSVELLMECEEHFEIKLSDKEAGNCHRVQDLVNIVCSKLLENGMRANPDVIFREVQDLTARQLGLKKEKIKRDSLFVKDLGLS